MKETFVRLPELKAELRSKAALIEAGFSREYIGQSDLKIASLIYDLPEYRESGLVLIYASVGAEPDTCGIMERALSDGKRVAAPVCCPGRELAFYEIAGPGCLCLRDKYGIPVPEREGCPVQAGQDAIALVPGVMFTASGERLGRGAGYYDRFLAGFRGFAAGLCRSDMLAGYVPSEDHDAPVDAVVTELGVYRRVRTSKEERINVR